MLLPVVLPDLFSADDCARIVAMAGAAEMEEARLVGGRAVAEKRRARLSWLDDEGEAAWVMTRMMRAIADANRAAYGFDIEAFEERAQVALYEDSVGGGFDWHSDVGDGPLARRRKLTVVVQLSGDADYEGGALEVNSDGTVREAPRLQGTGLAFPSFALHRVAPVTRGRRWSLTLWAHGAPFR